MAFKTKGEKQGSSRFYAFIEREQEVCILRYSLVPEYRSAIIRNYLPNPQLTVLLVLLLELLYKQRYLLFILAED